MSDAQNDAIAKQELSGGATEAMRQTCHVLSRPATPVDPEIYNMLYEAPYTKRGELS